MRGIKLLCIVLAAVFILCINLSAAGIKGGFNLSQFHEVDPDVLNQDYLTGFQVGIFFNILNLSPYIQIHPEVLYIRKGTKMSVMETVETNYEVRIDYIEVPVLLKINLSPEKFINPFIVAGPYWSYRARAKEAVSNGVDMTNDIKDEIKSSDFGLVGGVGIEFKLGGLPNHILIEARYEYGFVDIVKDPDFKAKNSSFVFNVGVGF